MARQRLIVCNTSPLINLAEIGRLDLLEMLPGEACIPPAVRDELRAILTRRFTHGPAFSRQEVAVP